MPIKPFLRITLKDEGLFFYPSASDMGIYHEGGAENWGEPISLRIAWNQSSIPAANSLPQAFHMRKKNKLRFYLSHYSFRSLLLTGKPNAHYN